jgi:hypothetical protein
MSQSSSTVGDLLKICYSSATYHMGIAAGLQGHVVLSIEVSTILQLK